MNDTRVEVSIDPSALARCRDEREARVLEAARVFVLARQSFIRIRTAKTVGRDVALARGRRDEAINRLVDAVEELDR